MANYKDIIKNLIETWRNDTLFLSNIDTSHPSFSIVEGIHKEISIPAILELMRDDPKFVGWFFVSLYMIVPKSDQPVLKEEDRGKFKQQMDMWLEWGEQKGYIKPIKEKSNI